MAKQPVDQSPAEALETLPGFKLELLLKADPKVNGSWINLAKDGRGRLWIGGQRGQPITRVTIGKDGAVAQSEVVKLPITETMGILFAFDSLYVDGHGQTADGKQAFGLWRLQSTKKDDNYDKVELIHEWPGGAGEHGAHGIVQGKDGRLYVVCGNFTSIGEPAPTSPHKNYQDDLVLPRAEDGNGFGAGKKPPGGFVMRMEPDGKNAELFASGERNTYDIAFNADGELFGFDSDMEWDWGMPWYRPIRVFHAASAADQGFREGSGKWPEYYEDSLPAAVNVGIGCPTGVAFGYGAKFPAKYQKAFYILDWTYGRLIAAHLKPNGSSYSATWENFVAPKSLKGDGAKTPNNLTDVVIGDDGAMYFTTGGRNTAAYLYRVTYAGNESTAAADVHDVDGADARAVRHQLEAFHGKQDPKAVETAWQHLGSPDRFIRYAARIAVETAPVAQWKDRALNERDPQAGIEALLALSRMGDKSLQPAIVQALGKFQISGLPEALQLQKARVIEVCLARMGVPAPESAEAKALVGELSPMYPAKSVEMNRELSQTLLALHAPDAVARTVKLLTEAPTQEEQVVYAHALRTIKDGWTPELRKQYFGWFVASQAKDHVSKHPAYVTQWFADAGRPYADGSSFPRFIGNFHADAEQTLTPAEKGALEPLLAEFVPPQARAAKKAAAAKPRTVLVKEYTMEDLEPQLAQVGHGRNFARGKAAFESAQCLLCHKFGNEGGAVGPDITSVATRFARRDILESIVLPSKVISEQYAATDLKLKNGDLVSGRIVEETDEKIVVMTNPMKPEDRATVKKADVAKRTLSKLSPMPEGLINYYKPEEILDMMAYIESGGRKEHPDFAK